MSKSKLLFLIGLTFSLLAVSRLSASEKKESAQLAEQRVEMKNRQRRIIYNNDGCDLFYPESSTPEGFLARRNKATLNTQVDSIFYCTGAATMFTHRAKVGEVYGKYTPEGMNLPQNIKNLDEKYDTDALELTIQFCHQNNLEVFFTHRINDIHDCFLDLELSAWKREHPHYLMGKYGDWDKFEEIDPRRRWAALDFEIPDVREYLLAIIEDVLSRYDLDGIEIDYLRNPLFFRTTRESKPATDEQIKILTGFQQQVRDLAYKHGNRRGRPILVCVRVPVTVSMCLYTGIDIEQWLKADLTDLLAIAVGCMPFTNPTKELVDLGHAHGVPVYPTICGSGRLEQQSIEHWRGAVANFWYAGADGVYLFNTFPETPQHPHFTELGDPKKLASMSKIFAIDNEHIFDGGIAHAIQQTQILPVELDMSGQSREVILPIGDDVASAAEEGRLKLSELRVQFEGRALEDKVEVRLNGEILESAKEDLETGWVAYNCDPSQYRQGDNVLALCSSDSREEPEPVVVKGVELRVEYR